MPTIGINTSAAGRVERVPGLLFLAALFLGPFSVVLWHSSRLTVLWDLSYILEHAYRISLGDVPYRDFAIPHPPLTFVIQAAIIRLFDSSYALHVFYCAIVAGLTAVLIYGILRFQLAESRPGDRELQAFLLALPAVFLNGYCILSQPFYDPDCVFWLLVALYGLLSARSRPDGGWRHVAAGVLILVPVFFKQNIGLAGFAAVHGCLLLSASRHSLERRRYAAYLAGSLLATLVAAGLIHAWVGIRTYSYWTITYAVQKRPFATRRVLFIYENWRTWLALASAACGVLVSVRQRCAPWMRRLALLLIALPLTYASLKVFSRPLSWEAAYFWVIALIGGSAAGIADWFRAGRRFESTMPVVAAAVVHGSFVSQGVGGSSYGVWPFLFIAMAAPAAVLARSAAAGERRLLNGLFALVAVLLLAVGYLHVSREERLAFVDTRGGVERAGLPRMKGLAAPGRYITEFERMVGRCAELVPPGESIVLVPGEDPFFFATRRRPRFPVVTFDDTITAYGAPQLTEMLRESRIDWVIVKTRLQLHDSPWSALPSLDLARDYQVAEVLPGYVVLKRTPDAGYHASAIAGEGAR
jgi:hypothetical protein